MRHLLIENTTIPHGKVGLNTLIELANSSIEQYYCTRCEQVMGLCDPKEIHCTSDFRSHVACMKCLRHWNFIIKKVENPFYVDDFR